jgi:hypothetical protein
MTPLSDFVDEALVSDLRAALHQGQFPGLDSKLALEFLLSDGIVPASGLPVGSLLGLEDWVRARGIPVRGS